MTNEANGTPRDENGVPGSDNSTIHSWNGSPQGTGASGNPYTQEPTTGYPQGGYTQPGYDANAQGQGYDAPGYTSAGNSQGYGQNYGTSGYGTQPTASSEYGQGYAAPQQPYGQSGYTAGFGAPAGGYLPGYGAPTLTPASFGRRVQGWLLNWLVGGLVLDVLSTLIFHPFRTTYNPDGSVHNPGYGSTALPGLVSFAILAVALGLLTRNGQAPGNRWAKTQIVDEMGRPVSGGKAIIRNIAHYVDNLICGIGWLFPLWDAKRQTLADKIMKTTVIDVSQTGPIA